jgi:hypothetical protein
MITSIPNDYISNLSCLPPFHSDMIETIKVINNCLYFSLARAPNVVINLGLSRENHYSVTTPSWLHTQRQTSNSNKHSTLQHFNTALTQLLKLTSNTKFTLIAYSQHFNHTVSTYHHNAQLHNSRPLNTSNTPFQCQPRAHIPQHQHNAQLHKFNQKTHITTSNTHSTFLNPLNNHHRTIKFSQQQQQQHQDTHTTLRFRKQRHSQGHKSAHNHWNWKRLNNSNFRQSLQTTLVTSNSNNDSHATARTRGHT